MPSFRFTKIPIHVLPSVLVCDVLAAEARVVRGSWPFKTMDGVSVIDAVEPANHPAAGDRHVSQRARPDTRIGIRVPAICFYHERTGKGDSATVRRFRKTHPIR